MMLLPWYCLHGPLCVMPLSPFLSNSTLMAKMAHWLSLFLLVYCQLFYYFISFISPFSSPYDLSYPHLLLHALLVILFMPCVSKFAKYI